MSNASCKSDPSPRPQSEHRLQLYVAGSTPRSVAALRNLEEFCAQHLPGRYHIEIIDLMKHPHLARRDNILAVPTLVRSMPSPVRKIVGNLSNPARVMAGLDLRAADADPFAARKKEFHV
jgi:circadian clock protein KaiB